MTKKKKMNSVFKAMTILTIFVLCLVVVVFEIALLDESNRVLADSNESVLGMKDEVISNTIGMAVESEDIKVVDSVLADDARLKIIEVYLARYKSPLLPYAGLILELSDNYEFDYRWIVAIAQQESNLCKKIPKDSHNCWGYGVHSQGTLRFENYDLALRSFASYLKTQYFDKGYDTVELIMSKYCPHSNGSWAYGIRQFFDEIENGDY